MIDFERKEHYGLSDLLRIVALLRSEGGCPWDRVQTHASLRRSLLEEAYEAAEAIDREDPALLKEELGDLLLQVVFHADIERQAGDFTIDDVADGETSVNAYNKLMDWGMQLLVAGDGAGRRYGAGGLGGHQAPGEGPADHRSGAGCRGPEPAGTVAGGEAPEQGRP